MLYDDSNSYNLENLLIEFYRLLFDVEKIAPLFSFGYIDEVKRKQTMFLTQFLCCLSSDSDKYGIPQYECGNDFPNHFQFGIG
jgi:truncated hemoglobin YjbI